jgi:hypothetical protein
MFSLSLAAILAGPVYAQVCSGGKDGGVDATGNQCNAFSEVAAFTTGPAITPPAQVTKPVTAHARSKKSTPTAIAVPASRQVRAAAPPSASVSALTENSVVAQHNLR